jgi:2-oxoisovalerate dehydrogenase E1 component alpha subunit
MSIERDRANLPPLALHVPEPRFRPGDEADFSDIVVPAAGATRRPDTADRADSFHELAYGLVRVLDERWPGGRSLGSAARCPDAKRRCSATMALTRAFDERMFRAQRQGKTSFYMKSTGRGGGVDRRSDGARRRRHVLPLLSPAGDPDHARLSDRDDDEPDLLEQGRSAEGRQLPIMYSAKEFGFFSISGNLATQYPQAVGWAMASAAKGDTRIAATWCGEGSTAEGDFHSALTFASVYKRAGDLQRRQQPMGDLELLGLCRGRGDHLRGARDRLWHRRAARRRKRRAGGLCRHAMGRRARADQPGPDPDRAFHLSRRGPFHLGRSDGQYRSAGEPTAWPLGDPIARLKEHLIALGEWDEARHAAQDLELAELVKASQKEAEKNGILGHGMHQPFESMFEGVFEEMPWHLKEQQQQMLDEQKAAGL